MGSSCIARLSISLDCGIQGKLLDTWTVLVAGLGMTISDVTDNLMTG